eukprot:TRINITY_DN1708_c0_g1_i1.p1 TRINITY_DN1708_c0_g1~~TRINITY_DN1708_c0_g1_i1.p1  ORF type:complete len:521 (+),score=64.18 TRINITY_DN1708_c0_g1_i1:60-1622(+)
MKLRIRPMNGGETIRLEVADGSTLRNLKDALAAKISLSSEDVSSISLTLNKKDAISGDENQDLQSLGITSGDLLFYALSPDAFQATKRERDEDYRIQATKRERDEDRRIEATKPERHEDHRIQVNSTKSVSTTEAECPMEIESAISSTLPSAQTMMHVPSYLIRVFSTEDVAKCLECDSHLLLMMAVHAAMLESGFIVCQGLGNNPSSCLLDELKTKPAVSVCYTLPELVNVEDKSDENVMVRFQHLGGFLVAYGCSKGAEVYRIVYRISFQMDEFLVSLRHAADAYLRSNSSGSVDTIPSGSASSKLDTEKSSSIVAESFIPKLNSEKKLSELWRMVKDKLALPLLTDLCQITGRSPPPSLMLLPSELKLTIFSNLPAVDIAKVGCVCAEFKYLCDNEELWKKKYKEEFGQQGNVHGHRWKNAFVLLWKQRKFAEQQRKEAERVHLEGMRLSRHNRHFQGGWLPGIIGGHYDAFPAPSPDSFSGLPGFPAMRGRRPSRRLSGPFCNLGDIRWHNQLSED